MTWIKICGITNFEDAQTAVEAGADALGFVFYEKSPRRVDVATAREIIARLPERVEKVGVFIGESGPDISEMADMAGLTALQLYFGDGSISRTTVRDPHSRSPKKIFGVIPVQTFLDDQGRFEGFAFFTEPGNSIEGILFDSGNSQVPGGTGKTFDWEQMAPMLAGLNDHLRVIVAGGLNPANVAQAMRILRPWGVDVASGVETRPGKKDPDKVRAFISAVREADRVH